MRRGGGDNTILINQSTYLGNVNTENLSSGFAAAIRSYEDGLIDANDTVKILMGRLK